MHYLLQYDYVENMLERRLPHREEHLLLAREAHARGEIVLGAAFTDPLDGALLIFECDGPGTVEDFIAKDPYVANGLVTRWRIRPLHVVFGGKG
jgi:uncharacterized protein YciI